MDQDLRAIKGKLEQRLTTALTAQAMANRGTFLPFRLPAAAQTLVAGLLKSIADGSAAAGELGRTFNQQGLALVSLHEAQVATLEVIAEERDTLDSFVQVVVAANRFFSALVEGFVAGETAEVDRQRTEMERAFMNAMAQRHTQEEQLRSAISELSTPIVPVHEGIMVLPLVGSIDSRRATEITERLLEAISAYQAEIVIIDITGISVVDTQVANNLLMTTRAANLLGSRVVLVGIGAEIAQTIVQLGVELHGLVTLANLQAGISYALEQQGLGIQRLGRQAERTAGA